MTALYVYDDERARTFEPFALTRPAGTLVVGASPVWLRWQAALRLEAAGLLASAHLADFDEKFAPNVAHGPIPAGSIVANARFAPAAAALATRSIGRERPATDTDTKTRAWMSHGRVAAVRTSRPLDASDFARGDVRVEDVGSEAGETAEIAGWWIDEVWDYVRLLPEQLTDDIERASRGPMDPGGLGYGAAPPHVAVVGDHPVLIAEPQRIGGSTVAGARIEPHVVLDASSGPIMIAHGAKVHAFTRLAGPCYVGRDSTILGGDVGASSIGPVCKVRGEVSTIIVLGYANKSHDGFVGHSYLGRWVNVGAGTITSNLKNTYSPVEFWTPRGERRTGLQFLGTFFGDHAKTGIGTPLTTGTVLGAGACVFGSEMQPKVVPPFAWGSHPPYDTFQLEKFLTVTERVMERRHVVLSARARQQLAASYEVRWTLGED
jgi:UDP-N-acetylglucosamine diphosphorylase / glucose-1-phosphate thymidylyltransferase / UDP-N-acetylgalactosamine diphosphorylase / glucosamine-1-phosphate N-acetyltransferase / galactosamine-1-phosphate N-acetyltransferase